MLVTNNIVLSVTLSSFEWAFSAFFRDSWENGNILYIQTWILTLKRDLTWIPFSNFTSIFNRLLLFWWKKKIPYCTIIMVTLHLFFLLLGPISFESQMTVFQWSLWAMLCSKPPGKWLSECFFPLLNWLLCSAACFFSFFLYFFTYIHGRLRILCSDYKAAYI